jgi:hypothetical protein
LALSRNLFGFGGSSAFRLGVVTDYDGCKAGRITVDVLGNPPLNVLDAP